MLSFPFKENLQDLFSFRFTLMKEHLVEFNQMAAAHAEGADDMLNRVMQRDNICMMALLESTEEVAELNNSKPKLVVTNAHIHWDPEYKDVKVIQSVMLMRELRQFLEDNIGGMYGFYFELWFSINPMCTVFTKEFCVCLCI